MAACLDSHRGVQKDTSATEIKVKDLLKRGDSLSGVNREKAHNLFLQAYDLSLREDYSEGVVRSVFQITADLFEAGKFDSCAPYYEVAYQHASRPECDRSLMPVLLSNRGTFHYLMGDKENAFSYFFQAWQAVKAAGVPERSRAVEILYNLHFAKLEDHDTAMAIRFLNEAQDLALHGTELKPLKLIYVAKATLFADSKLTNSARFYVNRVLAIKNGIDPYELMGIADVALATQLQLGNLMPLVEQHLDSLQKVNNDFQRCELQIRQARFYDQMGNSRLALRILHRVQQESVQKCFMSTLGSCYKALLHIYKKNRSYKEALLVQEKLNAHTDSIFNADKTKIINELEIKYKTAAKDKLLATNELKIKEQTGRIATQRTIITIILSSCLVIVLLFVWKYKNAQQRENIKEQKIILLQQQKELDNLKAKIEGEESERKRIAMDLHDGIGGFVMSSLMNVNRLAEDLPEVKRSKYFYDIHDLLTQTSSDIKRTARNLSPDNLVRLGLEETIKEFLTGITKPLSLEITCQFYGALDTLDHQYQLMLYRIIQELVHNVVKHANATTVLVEIVLSDDFLLLTVEDNGVGMVSGNTSGLGLHNIRNRVEQHFGGELNIESSPRGTTVTALFPKEKISWNA